ncbi:hypothetical protein FEI15_07065 [Lacticaseibacillus zeae]|uniref:Uncharacterized protein n=1 Tax=Lacticaseibacillus zeae TaxID=57037 RepID=A0A5R8LR40_LACZE|nr:hypothetical protein [Lacticaseibacillus zeae]TLF39702.1 hypothetical protein FEI15_07065 [Lacticaseibacillus zeae]
MMTRPDIEATQDLLKEASSLLIVLRRELKDKSLEALTDATADKIIDARRLLLEGDVADGRRA